LKISKESVCMSLLECMSKTRFNAQVLNSYYPKNILDDILRSKPIFDGQMMHKNSNGFTQTISESNKYNIEYKVLNKEILFHDTINHIVIKVKRMES